MPYSGPDDQNLPDGVKKLDAKLRDAWVKAFNAAFKQYDGDEGKAFAVAWAAVNRMRELHPDFQAILKSFRAQNAEEDFHRWLGETGFDPSAPFPIDAVTWEVVEKWGARYPAFEKLIESFRWKASAPTLKNATERGRFYRVVTATVTTSGNLNTYVSEELKRAARTLIDKPVNINHVKYDLAGENRIVDAEFEDGAVEAIAYVEDAEVNKLFDAGKIKHASIEGKYRSYLKLGERGVLPGGLVLTGLAFLTSDTEPGIESTEVALWEKLIEKIHDHRVTGEKEMESENVKEVGEAVVTKRADLPDRCFLIVPPDAPPSERKLLICNEDGELDADHVRNALARLNQVEGISPEQREEARKKAQAILKRLNPDYEPSKEESLSQSPIIGEKKMEEKGKVEEVKGEDAVVEKPTVETVQTEVEVKGEVEEKKDGESVEALKVELEKMRSEFEKIRESIPEPEGKGLVEEKVDVEGRKADYKAVIAEALRVARGDTRVARQLIRTKRIVDGKLVEANYGTSAAGSAIPEVWADDVLRLTPRKGVFGGLVKWNDKLRGKAGDTLHIPTISTVSFGAATEATGPTAQAPTTSSVPITIKERIAEIAISREVLEDAVPGLVDELNQEIRDAYEWDVDAQVLGWLNSPAADIAGTLSESGKMAGTVIAKAIGSFRAGTQEPVALVIHPVQEASLLQDSQFTNAATFGDSSIIKGGKVRNYLGLEILVSPQVASTGGTYRAYLLGKDALAASSKRDFTLDMDYNVETRQHLWVATARWGGTIVHPQQVYEIKTVNG